MALICRNCGTVNHDPGGDPTRLSCGACGFRTLQRQPQPTDPRTAAAIAGATVGGLVSGTPVGALVGALFGYIVGSTFRDKQ
jgi:hypothetical protein